jgi:hypothetical protein
MFVNLIDTHDVRDGINATARRRPSKGLKKLSWKNIPRLVRGALLGASAGLGAVKNRGLIIGGIFTRLLSTNERRTEQQVNDERATSDEPRATSHERRATSDERATTNDDILHHAPARVGARAHVSC